MKFSSNLTRIFIPILFSYFLSPVSSFAQLSGHTKGAAYAFGESYDIGHVFAELGLQANLKRGSTGVYGDVRFRTGIQFNQPYKEIDLREAVASYQGERFGIHLGSQIVKWGRADGFNPTGNLVRSNYFLLSGDPDDQLMGTWMVRLDYRITPEIELEVIGIPYYQPSSYRYDLFDFGANAVFDDAQLPKVGWKQGSLAGRLNFDLPAMGFSLSGFRGYDPFYGFDLDEIDWSSGQPFIHYQPRSYQKTAVGADFAIPVSRIILRGEVAWNQTIDSEENMYVPDAHLHYVGGIESSLAGITAILQYIGKYDPGFVELEEPILLNPQDPMAVLDFTNQTIRYESEVYNRYVFGLTDQVNHGVSLTLSKTFSYDLIQAELTAYYSLTTEEYLIRPKVSFNLYDGLSLSLGAQYMDGKEGSVFDFAGKVMSGGFIELKAAF